MCFSPLTARGPREDMHDEHTSTRTLQYEQHVVVGAVTESAIRLDRRHASEHYHRATAAAPDIFGGGLYPRARRLL